MKAGWTGAEKHGGTIGEVAEAAPENILVKHAPGFAAQVLGPYSRADGGFTLLEILVALAILAVALAAAMRVAGTSTAIVAEQEKRTLALWVGQNRLAEHRARHHWLEVGTDEGSVDQGGIRMRWQETVTSTPDPRFRRIEVRVFVAEQADRALVELAGFLALDKK